MNCAEVRDKLSEYLDGELTPSERNEIASHIERCTSCAWELETIRKTVQMLSSLPRFLAPAELSQELKIRATRSRPAYARKLFVLAGAAALILLAFLLTFHILGERPDQPALSSVEKVSPEKESPLARITEDLPAADVAAKETYEPHPDEFAKKIAAEKEKPQPQEMAVTRAESGKDSAERSRVAALNGARLKKEAESPRLAEKAAETADKAAPANALAVEVVEREIVIQTSDLKKDLDTIESLFAQIPPEGRLDVKKIDSEVSKDGAITLVFSLATEDLFQQLVQKVGALAAASDSAAPLARATAAAGNVPEDAQQEEKLQETPKGLKEEKAKAADLAAKPSTPAVSDEPAKALTQQSSGELRTGTAGAAMPAEGVAGASAPQKQQAQAEQKILPVRFVLRVKLVIVEAKK